MNTTGIFSGFGIPHVFKVCQNMESRYHFPLRRLLVQFNEVNTGSKRCSFRHHSQRGRDLLLEGQ
jgi:hypothetical protein